MWLKIIPPFSVAQARQKFGYLCSIAKDIILTGFVLMTIPPDSLFIFKWVLSAAEGKYLSIHTGRQGVLRYLPR